MPYYLNFDFNSGERKQLGPIACDNPKSEYGYEDKSIGRKVKKLAADLNKRFDDCVCSVEHWFSGEISNFRMHSKDVDGPVISVYMSSNSTVSDIMTPTPIPPFYGEGEWPLWMDNPIYAKEAKRIKDNHKRWMKE